MLFQFGIDKGNISETAFNFIVQEPKEIIEWFNDKCYALIFDVTHQLAFRTVSVETS
jgi:hypothetical protein